MIKFDKSVAQGILLCPVVLKASDVVNPMIPSHCIVAVYGVVHVYARFQPITLLKILSENPCAQGNINYSKIMKY